MKDKLIELTKKIGFTSAIIGKSIESLYSSKDFYYLWLCELQKWCREIQHLDVFVCDSIDLEYDWVIVNNVEGHIDHNETGHEDYRDALEEGLFKVCTIIKETN